MHKVSIGHPSSHYQHKPTIWTSYQLPGVFIWYCTIFHDIPIDSHLSSINYLQLSSNIINYHLSSLIYHHLLYIICHLPSTIIYRPSSIVYHLTSIIDPLSYIIYHLSSIIYHQSSIIYHQSSIISHHQSSSSPSSSSSAFTNKVSVKLLHFGSWLAQLLGTKSRRIRHYQALACLEQSS